MSSVQFLIQGLAAAEFAPLVALDAAALSARHIQGRTVTEAHDAAGWMLGCDVVQGEQLEPVLEDMLKLEGCAFVNLHYARAGCYAARATLA